MHSFNAGLMKWLTRLEKSRSRMKVGQTNLDTWTHPRSRLSSRLPRLGLQLCAPYKKSARNVCSTVFQNFSWLDAATTPDNVPSRGQRLVNHINARGRLRVIGNGTPQLKCLYVVSHSELDGHHSTVYATFSRCPAVRRLCHFL